MSNEVTPWVEKYRPRRLEDISYQDEAVSLLRSHLESRTFSNSLFYGPPGTGKTSTILVFARLLFQHNYSQRVLELNASDERGINVIREKVKKFSQMSVGTDESGQPAFKLIILDEADSMTSAAQAALRRIMEKEIRTTRFCIIGNYISRIIAPLTSRCVKVRFKPLPTDIMVGHLKNIAVKENLKIDELALWHLIDTCEGDMRKATMNLHSASMFAVGGTVTTETISEITGTIPPKKVEHLLTVLKLNVPAILKTIEDLLSEGYSSMMLLNELQKWILEISDLNDDSKSDLLILLSTAESALNKGADEYLQVASLLTAIHYEM